MRLHQHPEFRDAIVAASTYFAPKGISTQLLDCDRISRASFGDSYTPPPELSFRDSLALFPSSELQSYLSQEYTLQCRPLCYGDFPTWEEIVGCFQSCRDWL
jgi:hypothetical protein